MVVVITRGIKSGGDHHRGHKEWRQLSPGGIRSGGGHHQSHKRWWRLPPRAIRNSGCHHQGTLWEIQLLMGHVIKGQ